MKLGQFFELKSLLFSQKQFSNITIQVVKNAGCCPKNGSFSTIFKLNANRFITAN